MKGGKREGAGRPKGRKTNKALKIAEQAREQGITPLEVILQAMRWAYDAGQLPQAAAFAKDAAPYIHPRLASLMVDHRSEVDVTVRIQKVLIEAPIKAIERNGALTNGHHEGN